MANEDIGRRARQLLGLEPEDPPSAEAVAQGLPLLRARAYYCPGKERRLAEAEAAFELRRALELHTEFFGKLATGELEATYRPEPPRDDWRRELIPANMWAVLRDELVSGGRWPRQWYACWKWSRLLYGSSSPSKATKRYDDILVFPRGMAPEARREANGAPRLSPAPATAARSLLPAAELRRWYETHLADFRDRNRRPPSREEDWEIAQRELGPRVTRERLWEMREEFKSAGHLQDARSRGRPRRAPNSAE